jgi:SAM-dependent methyltransferase
LTEVTETDWLSDSPIPLRPALAAALGGAISPAVALARMLFAGATRDGILAELDRLHGVGGGDDAARDRLAALRSLALGRRDRLALVERMIAEGFEHRPARSAEDGIALWRATFDRLVGISPEASVAAFSLADPVLLDAATAEIVARLDDWGLLTPGARVLDLGCGIGRVAAALAPRAGAVTGIDIAPAMIETARRRCAGLGTVEFRVCSGRDLAGFADGAFDLVLAVDSFPYLFLSDPALVAAHLREAVRVLRPGGDLLVLNFSYRGDADADRADAAELAAEAGFDLLRAGEPAFAIWDGLAFQFRRPLQAGKRA